MNHPVYTAKEIAHMLDTDSVMASKIKEFIQPERLLELLDVEHVLTDKDILELVRKHELIEDVLEMASSRMLADAVRDRIM